MMVTELNKATEANKIANRRFYEEVINQQKWATFNEVVGTSYVGHSLPAQLSPDREGLKSFIGAFHKAFPDGQLTIDQMIVEENTIATRLTFRGTQTGEFQGLAPTGKKVTVPALDMARYEGGKLVEHWGGPDQLTLLQQLGLLPAMK
jgi:predicted ester cyclase